MAEKQIYFVQHGRCEETAQCEGLFLPLSGEGKEEANRVADELVQLNLGNNALVLTSNAVREAETAEIIANQLGSPVTRSKLIYEASRNVMAVKNLDNLIYKALKQEGKELGQDQSLVVVTNPMLMAAVSVKGGANKNDLMEWFDAERWYGRIEEYQPGTWKNLNYNNFQAFLTLGPEYEKYA